MGLILNPRSGVSHHNQSDAFLGILAGAGVKCRSFVIGRELSSAHAAKLAVEHGATMLVAAGGDGTVSGVAAVAVREGITLGILPCGSLNHFARDLHLPMNLGEAARVIAAGRTKLVDVAEVNGRIFLNNSSLGLYPRIAFWRERQRKLGKGRAISLIWATVRALWRLPMVHIRLHAEGIELRRTSPLVLIGNNRYELHGKRAGTRESLSEGCLSLYIARVRTRLGVVRLCARTLLGGMRQDLDMEFLSVSEAWMETRKKQLRVALDGEVSVVHSPMHYQSRPAALRVLVP